MVTKYIEVGDNYWGILVIYNFSVVNYDEMAAIMDSFGMSERSINKALRVLSTYNSGMAVSRDDLRMSAIFIGKPSSNAQFWNSISHELKHVHDAILEYYDVELSGEPSAYTTGYLLQRVVEEIAEPCYE